MKKLPRILLTSYRGLTAVSRKTLKTLDPAIKSRDDGRYRKSDIKKQLRNGLIIIAAAVFGMCALSACKQKQQQQPPQVQQQTQQAQQTQTKLSPCPGGSNSSICPIPINND